MRKLRTLILGVALSAAGLAACDSGNDDDAAPVCAWQGDALAEWMAAGPACENGACQGPTTQIVPSGALPAEVHVQDAANNLDATVHDCRVFLAFRTAPSHFADVETRLYVVSSADRQQWRYEGEFHLGTDLREPRLLSWDGRLFLYFALLGQNMLDFEPGGMRVSEYKGTGDWTEPAEFYRPGEGFIPWRVRVENGRPYMLTYVGGENIYFGDEELLQVHWLTSDDGLVWRPVVDGQPVVLEGGTSETDFVFTNDGGLVAVSRAEAHDPEIGWGMKICKAAPGALGDWQCVGDRKKYDSPLMFRSGDGIYLIGRRNLAGNGDYYTEGYGDRTIGDQSLLYELDYWQSPKRCSLWKIDPESLAVSLVQDLPSRGDTCFPSALEVRPGLFDVYNYSSPIEGEDVPWVTGQTGQTLIYRTMLSIE